MLLSEIFDIYIQDYIVMSNLSKKTEESYTCASRLLINYFGNVPIESLDFTKIREFKIHLSSWQKPDTVRNNIICVRNVLRFAARRNLSVMRFDEIPVPKREKRTITYLTRAEVKEFIKVVNRKAVGYNTKNRLRNVAIVTLLYATGLRNSELCSLNRDSIKNKSFTVIGKSKNPRICFIDDTTQKSIDNYLKLRTDSEKALFISHNSGKRITPCTLRRVFENACKNSRFENIHPHTIRHSFATDMLEHDVDLVYIADLLGHESLDTTKMYTHYASPKLREIYEKARK